MKRLFASVVAIAFCTPAFAQETLTVEALLKQDYEVVGVFPSNAGPGIFLVSDDGDRLVMCVVAETPDSDEVMTRYCKLVR